MSRLCRMLGTIALLSAVVGTAVVAREEPSTDLSPPTTVQPGVQAALWGNMPLYFIENQGQVDPQVAYYVQGTDKTLYFTPEGVTFVLRSEEESGTGESWVLKLEFVGANPGVQPVALDETGAVISYFTGRPEEWQTGLKTFSRIVYRDLWPGIDLEYFGTVNRLKYQFVIAAGADPQQIRLTYLGATQVMINEDGRLVVTTPQGDLHDDAPHAYQQTAGGQTQVEVAYVLEQHTLRSGLQVENPGVSTYSFHVGAYEYSRPLVLDPAVLVYCGFIGGSAGGDPAEDIAVDNAGNAYVVGWTLNGVADGFPVKVGPDTSDNGSSDAFVAKVNAAGTALEYCGYIGGAGMDGAFDIAVDSQGNAYVVGTTYSSQSDGFPVAGGPDLTFNGGADAFLAKIDATGTTLVYAGYIGGEGEDVGRGIALGSDGAAFVTGTTSSRETSFPVLVGPDLTLNFGSDAFIAKVAPSGELIQYCGYLGNVYKSGYAADVAVDGEGCAYITGGTLGGLPATVGPDLTYNGSGDAYVAKVRADGTDLVYCGYIGGESSDQGCGIAVDSFGCAYITGETSSSEIQGFPVRAGPDLTYNGYPDAFVAKIAADGTELLYCGYIGGTEHETGFDIAVDAIGNAFVTGWTHSSELAGFPAIVGPDVTYNGGEDAFVAKVVADGSALEYCGYIGGEFDDSGSGIAVDDIGNAYIVGIAGSAEFEGFPVTVGPDQTYNGDNDAFVAKVQTSGSQPSVQAGGPYTCDEGAEVIVTASGDDPDGDALTFAWDLDNDGIFETPGQSATFSAASLDGPSIHTIAAQAVDSSGLSATDQTTVEVLNVAPELTTTSAPTDPIEASSVVAISAHFEDAGSLDSHTAVWDWGDGSTSTGVIESGGSWIVSGSHVYTSPGVYVVKLTVTDKDGASVEAVFEYIVIYDPSAGFVTGGGWIDSPEGAYAPDPALVGKATFGFVSKYQKGATVPTGVTQFQFKVADLNFHSEGYDWLVIAGARAQYKGVGTINGAREYKFMLTALDADINANDSFEVDRFRIKIWEEDESVTETVIYDNGLGAELDDDAATTEIGGGSIVIHKEK